MSQNYRKFIGTSKEKRGERIKSTPLYLTDYRGFTKLILHCFLHH